MDNIKQIILQEENEARYSRKHIDKYIQQEIADSTFMQDKIVQGVDLIQDYLGKSYYESKNRRLAQIVSLDLTELVTNLFIGIAYFQIPELFTSATAQLSGRLGLSDRKEAITTVAEILAVLCMTDAFDINKEDKLSSLMLTSRIPLSKELLHYVENSLYLPPMVCVPNELTNNYSSGYLTHNDSLVLGTGNHHDGDLCLDVLNAINSVALKLDTEFLSTIEEEPTFELDNQEKIDNWTRFKKQSYNFYSLIANQGNEFYLTNKIDKRGRIYSQGYHINTQGTSFKKAMIELAHEELVTGMP